MTEKATTAHRIMPITGTLEERLEQLAATNQVAWSGRKVDPARPVARLQEDKTVAEILLEDRQ